MRNYRNDVTLERLKELCFYDRQSGALIWRKRSSFEPRSASFNTRYAGKKAGRPNVKGYIYLRIDGVNYAAHRLVWLYCYGLFPKNDIDHLNRNRGDNRIENLRDATCSENNLNRSIKPGLGVWFDRRTKRYRAYADRNGKRTNLGNFESRAAADAARSQFLAAT